MDNKVACALDKPCGVMLAMATWPRRVRERPRGYVTMTLLWTVENQDLAGKWFRVTAKPFENRDDAIAWCNTLRDRWTAERGGRVRGETPERSDRLLPYLQAGTGGAVPGTGVCLLGTKFFQFGRELLSRRNPLDRVLL